MIRPAGRFIHDHEGTLERFAGDGIMVFFNDPVPVENPAERAVRTALAVRDRVGALAAAWRAQGWELGLGAGVAQGYATLGAIGFEDRWDYAAIGTVTNLAARLCAEAQAGEVLISGRMHARVEALVEAEALPPLALKGLGRPVPAARVLGLIASFHTIVFAFGLQIYSLSRAGYYPRVLSLTHGSRKTPQVALCTGAAVGLGIIAAVWTVTSWAASSAGQRPG